ncbi:MAG: hypothetical protein ABR881_18855 [Candidatus Sulfotelmatobacter sp.]
MRKTPRTNGGDQSTDIFIKLPVLCRSGNAPPLPAPGWRKSAGAEGRTIRPPISAAAERERYMKWFKHDSDFRQRPYMKFVRRRLGAEGVAAAYLLLEVMAESFRKDVNEVGTLTLSVPYTEQWLAEELGLFEEDPYGGADYPSVKKLKQILNVFHQAGFIRLAYIEDDGTTLTDEDTIESTKCKFTTITVPGFVGMVDEYTARRVTKGLRSPE